MGSPHGALKCAHNRNAAMKLNITPVLVVLIMSLSVPLTSQAARPLGPPIEEFFNDRNRVASGVVVEKLKTNAIEFRVDDYLHQSDDELVTLRVDADVFAEMEVGNSYVFVFSRMSKNRLFRDQWEVDVKGPSLVKARGLGTSAIYRHNATTFALLTPPDLRDELSADAETAMLLELAEDKADVRARELAIFELYLRPDLLTAMSGDNAQRYAAIAGAADTRLKNYLLEGATHFPEEYRAVWLEREWREAVESYGTELDLNSYVPLLIINALSGLRREGLVVDVDTIGKHLYSNAPGVAKAALAYLDAIDRQQALARVQQVLASEDMHSSTRRAFTAYVNQNNGA